LGEQIGRLSQQNGQQVDTSELHRRTPLCVDSCFRNYRVVWSMRAAVVNVYNPTTIFYNKAIATLAASLAAGTPAKRESERIAERNRRPVDK
jgi:hypothetical protein